MATRKSGTNRFWGAFDYDPFLRKGWKTTIVVILIFIAILFLAIPISDDIGVTWRIWLGIAVPLLILALFAVIGIGYKILEATTSAGAVSERWRKFQPKLRRLKFWTWWPFCERTVRAAIVVSLLIILLLHWALARGESILYREFRNTPQWRIFLVFSVIAAVLFAMGGRATRFGAWVVLFLGLFLGGLQTYATVKRVHHKGELQSVKGIDLPNVPFTGSGNVTYIPPPRRVVQVEDVQVWRLSKMPDSQTKSHDEARYGRGPMYYPARFTVYSSNLSVIVIEFDYKSEYQKPLVGTMTWIKNENPVHGEYRAADPKDPFDPDKDEVLKFDIYRTRIDPPEFRGTIWGIDEKTGREGRLQLHMEPAILKDGSVVLSNS